MVREYIVIFSSAPLTPPPLPHHHIGKMTHPRGMIINMHPSEDDMRAELTWDNVYRDETQRDEIKRRIVVLEHVVEMMMMMIFLLL